MDLKKLTVGKHLTELETSILEYIIENIDTVLKMGVREIAKNNYTSPASVIRLSKKLGYTGFVDMYYHLLPKVKKTEHQSLNVDEEIFKYSLSDILKKNQKKDIHLFVEKILHLKQKYIFIYATGFSAIAAEYLYKKLLVLGKKTIIATGTDSIGIVESNLEDIGIFIVISKSGETQQVMDKLLSANEQSIFTVSFTKEEPNRIANVSDLNFKLVDNNELDDRNILPNTFFPNLLLLFEYLFKVFLDQKKLKIEE